MNPLLETAVQQWQSEGLSLLVPDDLHDFIELARLADAVKNEKPSPEYLAALEPVAVVGGKTLHRMTIGAGDFFTERCAVWFADNPTWTMRSLFYCLAEGHDPERLFAYATPSEWKRHVKAWFRGVDSTWRQAMAVLTQFLEIERKADEEDAKATLGRSDRGWMLELLWYEYGHDEHYWLWTCPRATVQLLWDNLMARKEAERRAGGERFARDPDGTATRTLFKFQDAVEALRQKLANRKEHGQRS